MNRLETIRRIVDDILRGQPDQAERYRGFVHLYGVSVTCTLIAQRRGLDLELASLLGLLHDLHAFRNGKAAGHATQGALLAAEILEAAGTFSADEIALISQAITRHSDKKTVHGPYDELLKDADVLQRYLHDPAVNLNGARSQRLARVLAELAIPLPRPT